MIGFYWTPGLEHGPLIKVYLSCSYYKIPKNKAVYESEADNMNNRESSISVIENTNFRMSSVMITQRSI